MKYFLTVLLLCACFMNLTKGSNNVNDCKVVCLPPMQSAFQTNSEPIVCRAAQTALDCCRSFGIVEPIEVSENDLKRRGFTCHLSASSSVSGSLLTILCALLLTAIK